MRNCSRFLSVVLIAGVLTSAGATTVSAQVATESRAVAPDVDKAQQVRAEFMKVLQKYPPALGIVLKADPTMIANDQYLAPYPAVAAFVAQHPEVRRSPAFYLEQVRSDYGSYYYDPAARAWDNMVEMVSILVVMLTMLGAFGWLVRTAMDYRRWGRLAKVQAEAHTKLLDRFTGNEELLAYVKSPAGTRFLESSPISLDGGARTMGSPVSRILWSMQAGVVLAAAGVGMYIVSGRIDPIRAEPIFTLSVIVLSLGIGFVASAGLSYVLSKRLGLFVANSRETVDV